MGGVLRRNGGRYYFAYGGYSRIRLHQSLLEAQRLEWQVLDNARNVTL